MLRIRTKILWANALTVLVTVALLGSLSYFILVDALTGVQRQQMIYESEVAAEKIAGFFQAQANKLAQIEGQDFYGKMGDLPLAKHLAAFEEAFPVLSVVNRVGKEDIRMVEGSVAFYRNDWNDSEIFARALKNPNKVVFSNLAYSQDLKQPVIWAALARFGYFGDEFLGTTIGAIPISKVAHLVEDLHVGGSGYFTVVDRHGTVLVHPLPGYRLSPLTARGDQGGGLARDIRNLRPSFLRTTVFNTDSFIAMSPIPELRWQVLALRDYHRFMQAPNRQRMLALVVCGGMLIVGLTIAQLFARRLTGRIGEIIRHTEYIAAGNLSRRIEIDSGDEMEQMAGAFNAMSAELDRANQARETVARILQSIIDPLFIADRQGRITEVNPSAVALFHCEPAQIVGRKLDELFAAEDPFHKGHKLREMLAEGPIRNVEAQIRTLQGDAVPVLFSCSLTGTTGAAAGMVAILKDISHRKQAEWARLTALSTAEEAREKIDAILQAVSDGLIVTDCERRIILLNPVAEKLTGLRSDQALNRSAAEVIAHPQLRRRLFYAGSLGGPPDEEDLEMTDSATGNVRYLHARTTAVRRQDGAISGFLTLLRDVTRERQVDRMKSEFITTAAHELRTPLTAIIGYGELLTTPENFGEFSAQQRDEFIREMVSKAEALHDIVNELLDISRIESGHPIPMEKKHCDLGALLDSVVRHFNAHSQRHDLKLELPEERLDACWLDENKIVQVMENLLSNAVKYSPEGGEIQVLAEKSGDRAQVRVRDHGIGMSDEQVASVFDKFYRVDASDTAVGGLGLGMSIVRNIVEAHGGSIEVKSRPGAGTLVTVILPIVDFSPDHSPSALPQS